MIARELNRREDEKKEERTTGKNKIKRNRNKTLKRQGNTDQKKNQREEKR